MTRTSNAPRCDTGPDQPLRLAVVSTPRSGNTWLRRLLSGLYQLEERAVHDPAEVGWDRLPKSCVLQLHWRRSGTFPGLLRRHGFRPVVIARHPLDVLISLLHWVLTAPVPRSAWGEGASLAGESGDETPLIGAAPLSPAFLDYASGPRAAALLAVSRDWWAEPDSLKVRYEDLVRQPADVLQRLTAEVGRGPASPVSVVAEDNRMDRLRGQNIAPREHFWQGKPGLWRALLTADAARRIAAAQAGAFRELGYRCDPNEFLDSSHAETNWRRLRQMPLHATCGGRSC